MKSPNLTKKEFAWGLFYYFLQLIVLPSALSLINYFLGNPLSLSMINVVYFSLNFLIVCVIFGSFLKKNAKIALESPLRCIGYAAGGYLIYRFISYGVAILIFMLKPDFFNVNDAHIGTAVKENHILLPLATIFLVPVAEEALYRGLMFRPLHKHNRFLAYAVSTLVFASVHVVGYIGQYSALHLFLCLLQYLPAGIALGFAYEKSDTICAPILMHIAVNAIGILAMR